MKFIIPLFCMAMFLSGCSKSVDVDYSGEWQQVPETSSLRKLTITQQGNNYHIQDEFWLDKTDMVRPSTSGSGIAEVNRDGAMTYQNVKGVEFRLTDPNHLTLLDKSVDAVVNFEKVQ